MKTEPLISHLEALRKMLIRCIAAVALFFPLCYAACPFLIKFMVKLCFPEPLGGLHYFAPMEVFIVQLNLALILSLAVTYPWSILQIWKFLLPGLYDHERKILGWWIFFSSVLFFGGVVFSTFMILPLIMNFSSEFASTELQPMLGLGNFLKIAGMLALAFGIMFQAPIIAMLAVRFGLITSNALKQKRPYILTAILILAALLTPPDIISQLMLAIPTWGLFEIGIFFAARFEKKQAASPLPSSTEAAEE